MTNRPVLEIAVSSECDAIEFFQQAISLGDSLVQVVKVLQKFDHAIGRVNVDIKDDVILFTIPAQSILLEFTFATQRLKKITLQQVQNLIITYQQKYFSSPKQSLLPTLREIDQHFGATRPGSLNEAQSLYTLSYQKSQANLNFEFNSASSKKVSNDIICERLIISDHNDHHHGNELGQNQYQLEKVQIYPNSITKYTFHFNLRYKSTRIKRVVRFNDTCQNIQSELGSPDEVFFKTSARHPGHRCPAGTDFFYNYFKLGVDFLIDGQSRRLKKVIFHTCRPEHQEFGKRYIPCMFEFKNDARIADISQDSTFADLKPLIEDEVPVLLTRNNCVNEDEMVEELAAIAGAGPSSGFVYHSTDYLEIYEFTGNGKLAIFTLY